MASLTLLGLAASQEQNVSKHVLNLKTAIAGAVGTVGLGAFIVKSAQAAQETENYARALGTSTKSLTAFGYAAKTVGVDQGKLNDILKDTAEKIGDAYANGGGEAVDVLKRLNLNAAQLVALSPDKQMLAIAGALQQVGTQAEKVQILEALASDASLLLPLLDNNAASLRNLMQEAVATGAAFDGMDVAKISEANQALQRSGAIIQGIGVRIAGQLAPYVTAIAQQFLKASVESRGFGEQTIMAIESITHGVAYVADVFRGLHAVWNGLELAFAKVAEGIWLAFDKMVGRILAAGSKLPFVGEKFGEAADLIHSSADAARERVDSLSQEFDMLILKPMPSDNVKAFFDSVLAEADKAAQEVASSRASITGGAGGLPQFDTGTEGDKTKTKLEALQEQLASESEVLNKHYAEQRLLVWESYQQDLIGKQQRDELIEQLEVDHQNKLNAIAYKGMAAHKKFATAFRNGDVKSALQSGAELTAGVAQQNKAMFQANKAFALANAAVTLPDAVLQSFRNGGGYPWGLVPAGLMLAKGLSQIQAINSASFGGGGTAPSVGGTAAPPVSPVSANTGTAQTAIPDKAEPTRKIYVEFTGADSQNVPLRAFREQLRRLKEDNPDAQLVF